MTSSQIRFPSGHSRRHWLLAALLALVAGTVSSAASVCTAPQAAIVAWFPGDGNANDISGSGFNGTLMNGATATTTGKVGQAFSFDGVDDYVRVGPVMAGFVNFTMETWVKTTQNVTTSQAYDDPAIIGTKQGSGNSQDIVLTNRGGMLAWFDELGGGENAVNTGVTIADGNWHHVAVTRQGAALLFYVDGIAAASSSTGLSGVRNDDIEIGRAFWIDPSLNFAGLIDEPAVYDRALSAAEIQSIYEAGSNGKCKAQSCATPPPGLLSWYRGENDVSDSQGPNTAAGGSGVTFVAGKVGRAIRFNGAESLDTNFTPPNIFSLSMWYLPDANQADNAGLFSTYGFGNFNGLYISRASGASAQEFYRFDGNQSGSLPASPAGVWTHLLVTSDGSEIRFYKNGQLAATSVGTTTHAGTLFLGDSRFNGRFFAGALDETQVFNRVLSAQEIKTIFAKGSAGQCATCTPKPASNVLWLKGEGNANDSSGNGINGSLQNGAAATAAGIIGQAFTMGASGVVEIPNVPALRNAQPTYAAWVRPEAVQTADFGFAFVQYHNAGNLAVGFAWKASEQRFVLLAPLDSLASSADVFPPGAFYFVAVSYDGSRYRLYVNGKEQASLSGAGNAYGGQFLVGNTVGNNYPFNGIIDEFQIFSGTLSGSEIDAIYRAGSRGVCTFCFAPENNADLNRVYTSAPATITGVASPAAVSVTGGSYSVGCTSSYITTATTISNGQSVCLRLTSSASTNTPTTATLTVGGVPADYVVTTHNCATGTGRVTLAATTANVAEATGQVNVTVNRTGITSGCARVNYTTVNSTAAEPGDFTARSSSLNWLAGDASAKTISVPIINDMLGEATEAFRVQLATPVSGVTLGTAVSTVSIVDDDSSVLFSPNGYAVAEEAGTVSLTVQRTGGGTGAVSVGYSTSNVTALAGQDYASTSGILNWAAGDTTPRTIVVTVLDDAASENMEGFRVTLSAATGATLGRTYIAQVNITDTDTGSGNDTLQFSPVDYAVNEGAGAVTLTATRSGTGVGAVSINYQLYAWPPGYFPHNGVDEALAGSDYTGVTTGTLSWANGDTTAKTLTFNIVNDAVAENPETFAIEMTTATNAQRGRTYLGVVKITDND